MKRCSGCGQEKAATAFGVDPTCRDGLRSRCKACRAGYNKTWRDQNAEGWAERQAAYRRANADRIAITQAARRSADQETVLRHSADRRARKRAAFVETVRRSEIWERDAGVCGICHEPADPANWHLDHIIPLARGGTHEVPNVQVSHPSCNQRKGSKSP